MEKLTREQAQAINELAHAYYADKGPGRLPRYEDYQTAIGALTSTCEKERERTECDWFAEKVRREGESPRLEDFGLSSEKPVECGCELECCEEKAPRIIQNVHAGPSCYERINLGVADKMFCMTNDGRLFWCAREDWWTEPAPVWKELREVEECECCEEETALPVSDTLQHLVKSLTYIMQQFSCSVLEALEVWRGQWP